MEATMSKPESTHDPLDPTTPMAQTWLGLSAICCRGQDLGLDRELIAMACLQMGLAWLVGIETNEGACKVLDMLKADVMSGSYDHHRLPSMPIQSLTRN